MKIKRWFSLGQKYKINKDDNKREADMSILAKPVNFTIIINEENEHLLRVEKDEEYMKKVAGLKRKAKMFSENLK